MGGHLDEACRLGTAWMAGQNDEEAIANLALLDEALAANPMQQDEVNYTPHPLYTELVSRYNFNKKNKKRRYN
jgi:hypothetical protein